LFSFSNLLLGLVSVSYFFLLKPVKKDGTAIGRRGVYVRGEDVVNYGIRRVGGCFELQFFVINVFCHEVFSVRKKSKARGYGKGL